MRKNFLLLLLIFLAGLLLRFYQLGNVPLSMHRDEAFLGYNAYSILYTGKDISGNFLPLHLQSFLYSPAGYSYVSIPFISALGLNVFSVRFASALLGSITVILVYVLAILIFAKHKQKNFIALFAAFFLAISPWHINLSRTATENTIVVFFMTLGVICYVFWIQRRRWYWLFLSATSFLITFYTYQAPRSFLPFFLPLLGWAFWQFDKQKKYMYGLLFLFFCIAIVPLVFILNSRTLSTRLSDVSVFSTPQTQLILDEQLREDGISHTSSVFTRFWHNKIVDYQMQIWQNYVNHFSYNFLFTDAGFPDRYRVPSMGLLYVSDLLLILSGIWVIFQTKDKVGIFTLGWLLLVPIGSALTFDDVPNLQRTLLMVIPFALLAGLGASALWQLVRREKWRKVGFAIGIGICLYQFLFYMHAYYVHMVVHRTLYRQEGYKDLVQKINTYVPRKYAKAVITQRESAPAIFFLFYNRYNPRKFQLESRDKDTTNIDTVTFSHFEFTSDECPIRIDTKTGLLTGVVGVVYVNSANCKEIPDARVQLLDIIKRPDESMVFRLYTLTK